MNFLLKWSEQDDLSQLRFDFASEYTISKAQERGTGTE
jgi:hypothetical protein